MNGGIERYYRVTTATLSAVRRRFAGCPQLAGLATDATSGPNVKIELLEAVSARGNAFDYQRSCRSRVTRCQRRWFWPRGSSSSRRS